jgi:hypothetical protein
MIASLQSSVTTLQERLAKPSKPVTAKAVSAKPAAGKPAAKPAMKTAQKAPLKKKTLTRSSGVN